MNRKYKNPIQFDTIYQILLKNLGNFDEISMFSAHICHESVDMPFQQLISTLLAKNIDIHTLLTALSACEKRRVQYAFDSTKALPAEAQLSSVKNIIAHFNSIQDMMLSTAEKYYKEVAQRTKHDISNQQSDTGNRSLAGHEIKNQNHQLTISNSIQYWSSNGSISIRNYYQGLTIKASAKFISSEENILQIHLNEEVARIFAIHPSEENAFAVCDNEKIQLKLNIINIANGIASLQMGKTFPIYTEDREHLNIQVQENIPVTIDMLRKRSLSARLYDLSLGGLGISIQGISQAPYNIGDKVKCMLSLQEKIVTLSGTVRWVGNNEEESRVGIELQGTNLNQHLIQKEIFRMQRSIINSINQLELPATLAKGLSH